jgi:transcriptional regulator with XRE-family HTH domain
MTNKNRLYEWRKRLSFSMQELGVSAGCSPATLVAIERYNHLPTPRVRQKIASAMGVKEEQIWPNLAETAEVAISE